MEEAAAIKFVIRQNALHEADKDTDAESVIASIAKELKDVHDKELVEFLERLGRLVITNYKLLEYLLHVFSCQLVCLNKNPNRIFTQSEDELRINRESEMMSLENQSHSAVVAVLTNYEGAAEDNELIKGRGDIVTVFKF